jgi:lysophospholipase L1-like esterase
MNDQKRGWRLTYCRRFLARLRVATVLGLLFTLGVSTPVKAEDTNKPTVVCLGDSITHAGYPAELEKMLPARVINAGVPGNTSRQGLARLGRDVLSQKPAAVVVLFGTNDNREDAPRIHVPVDEYERNLKTIIERCNAIGAKVVLGTIPPIDPKPYFTRHDKAKFDAAGGLEKLIERYRAAALRAGKLHNVPVVDLNRLLANERGWRRDDGVHPTAEGNRLLAKLFFEQVKKTLQPTAER